jgi:hypothetical protein
MKKLLVCIAGSLFLYACNPTSSHRFIPKNGKWVLAFHTQNIEIPIQAEWEKDTLTIINGTERIPYEIKYIHDSVKIPIPDYTAEISGRLTSDSTFEGAFIKLLEDNYSIPVYGTTGVWARSATSTAVLYSKYEIEIDRKTQKAKAMGLFSHDNNRVTGSFATETGDYRFLSGVIKQNKLHLTTFDGSHLFDFKALILGDSLVDGTFISGKTG